MRICHFEDAGAERLEPLSLTRPVFDLLCGITSLADKQSCFFAASERGALVRLHLTEVVRLTHPELRVNDVGWLRAGPVVLVNGRWLPPSGGYHKTGEPHLGVIDGEVAYAQVGPAQMAQCLLTNLDGCLRAWRDTLPLRPAPGVLLRYPWDLVEHNAEQIRQDFHGGGLGLPAARGGAWAVVGPAEHLAISPLARVEPMALFDTTSGPIVLADGAVVTAFSRVEGPCFVGPGTQVMGAKIRGGTTFGPQCRIGGEVEASIVHGYSNKYHEGFLGHSYVGEWVNLGAGTHNSDLRNDYGEVKVPIGGIATATGLSKVGCYIGDHSKTGLGTLINTGSNVGAFANLLPAGMLAPKYVPSFASLWRGTLRENADLDGLLTTADKVMGRRGHALSDAHVTLYRHLFEATAFVRHRALLEADGRKLYRAAL